MLEHREAQASTAGATDTPRAGQRIQSGSRIRTLDGEIGRVQRLDADDSIAYVQLDAKPTPDDGIPIAVDDLELIPPE
jgi:hypothetical protein